MSHKCPTKVLSDFFVRHLPTSPFFKLACLKSVVSFSPRTKYFHLWNTYFGRAAWYSFQKNRTSVAPKLNASSWIFSLFLGLTFEVLQTEVTMLGSHLHWTTVCTGWQHLEGIPANHLLCFPFKSGAIQCPTLIAIARGTL